MWVVGGAGVQEGGNALLQYQWVAIHALDATGALRLHCDCVAQMCDMSKAEVAAVSRHIFLDRHGRRAMFVVKQRRHITEDEYIHIRFPPHLLGSAVLVYWTSLAPTDEVPLILPVVPCTRTHDEEPVFKLLGKYLDGHSTCVDTIHTPLSRYVLHERFLTITAESDAQERSWTPAERRQCLHLEFTRTLDPAHHSTPDRTTFQAWVNELRPRLLLSDALGAEGDPEDRPVRAVVSGVRTAQVNTTAEDDKRRRIAGDKVAVMEQYFQHTPKPTRAQYLELANQIEEPVERVRIWFTNKRNKGSKPGSVKE